MVVKRWPQGVPPQNGKTPRRLPILWLLHDGPDESQAVGNANGLLDLRGGPLTRAPVEAETFLDDMVKSADDLLHRSSHIRPMSQYDVHVIELEAFERSVQAFDDVLQWERSRQDRACSGICRPEALPARVGVRGSVVHGIDHASQTGNVPDDEELEKDPFAYLAGKTLLVRVALAGAEEATRVRQNCQYSPRRF